MICLPGLNMIWGPMPDYHLRIKELPSGEQPRERLRDQGADALTDAELLAILLRVGVPGANVVRLAQQLLHEYGGWPGLLRVGYTDLCQQHGVGNAKAATVKAALEIGRRLTLIHFEARQRITSPDDAARLLLLAMGYLAQEELRVICLDTKLQVQKIHTVYVGNINSIIPRMAEIFREPIRLNSHSIIVAHNHPSGDPTPSPEDIEMTGQMMDAGELLGIDVLDHLVIGQGNFRSIFRIMDRHRPA